MNLSGEVEVDGAYFGGHIRPANRKEDRIDRRLAEHQTGKRRAVVVMRERKGRTLPFVFRGEDEAVSTVVERVLPDSVVYADEATVWDALHARFETHRINHSVALSDDSACTNQVESNFSRLRRMVSGQHHHVSPHYLYQYANEAAFEEDHRRSSNGSLAHRVVGLAMAAPVSRNWAGYWQRAA